MAEAVLAVPSAAMGVLGFIGVCIGRQSYWRETYRVLAAPSLLSLLSIIVACHPPMHPQARLWHFHASLLPALATTALCSYAQAGRGSSFLTITDSSVPREPSMLGLQVRLIHSQGMACNK